MGRRLRGLQWGQAVPEFGEGNASVNLSSLQMYLEPRMDPLESYAALQIPPHLRLSSGSRLQIILDLALAGWTRGNDPAHYKMGDEK
eukprot:1423108-Pyramimonas_sp.AAC.2